MASRLEDRDFFDSPENVQEHLGSQLKSERLAIVLGSGASAGLGLPEWGALIAQAFEKRGLPLPSDVEAEDAAEILLDDCGGDRVEFCNVIRDALYGGLSGDFKARLDGNPLIRALGDLFPSSRRGHVRHVITFNYDDLLETYLEGRGYDVNRVTEVPAWWSSADARVYHPHGCLRFDRSTGTDIVLAQIDFDKVVGKATDAWRSLLIEILSSHTTVFIGVSGKDTNLSSILAEVRERHVAMGLDWCFWGFRFSDNHDDPRRKKWERRGIGQLTVGDYAEVPEYLKAVAQRAANIAKD